MLNMWVQSPDPRYLVCADGRAKHVRTGYISESPDNYVHLHKTSLHKLLLKTFKPDGEHPLWMS